MSVYQDKEAVKSVTVNDVEAKYSELLGKIRECLDSDNYNYTKVLDLQDIITENINLCGKLKKTTDYIALQNERNKLLYKYANDPNLIAEKDEKIAELELIIEELQVRKSKRDVIDKLGNPDKIAELEKSNSTLAEKNDLDSWKCIKDNSNGKSESKSNLIKNIQSYITFRSGYTSLEEWDNNNIVFNLQKDIIKNIDLFPKLTLKSNDGDNNFCPIEGCCEQVEESKLGSTPDPKLREAIQAIDIAIESIKTAKQVKFSTSNSYVDMEISITKKC